MLVHRFEPQGRRFTNVHYYYDYYYDYYYYYRQVKLAHSGTVMGVSSLRHSDATSDVLESSCAPLNDDH